MRIYRPRCGLGRWLGEQQNKEGVAEQLMKPGVQGWMLSPKQNAVRLVTRFNFWPRFLTTFRTMSIQQRPQPGGLSSNLRPFFLSYGEVSSVSFIFCPESFT